MALSSSTIARAVLTGLVTAVLVFPIVAAAGSFGRRAWWVALGSFLGIATLVAAGALYRQGRRERAEGESVWEVIPDWQYEGRHVESGGLTRGEQEQALHEIHERAESEERCSE